MDSDNKQDPRGVVIRKYLNDLNGYMQDVPQESLTDYDQIMNLYENDRGNLKVDLYFYTIKGDKEVFKLEGSKLTKNGLYRKSDSRFYDVNLLFDYNLTNLLLFIFLRDVMYTKKYDFSCVTNTYRLDKANFGKFYKEVLVYFL